MASLTPNFGLNRMSYGDDFAEDGYKYTDADRVTIDSLLHILMSHDHNGGNHTSAPVEDAPSLDTVNGDYGSIPAGTRTFYRVAWVDQTTGLESAASPESFIDTPNPISTPDAPEIGRFRTGYNLLPGMYVYCITAYTSASSLETAASSTSTITLPAVDGNEQGIMLTFPEVPSGASGFNVYRRQPGSTSFNHLVTLPELDLVNNDYEWIDEGTLSADCERMAPNRNTTNAVNYNIIDVDEVPPGHYWRVYRTHVAGQWNSTLLSTVVEETSEGSGIITPVFEDIGGPTGSGSPTEFSPNFELPGAVDLDHTTGRLPVSRLALDDITVSVNSVLTDEASLVRMDSSSPTVLTVPTGLPDGFLVWVLQEGTGSVTVEPDFGVSLEPFDPMVLDEQYSSFLMFHMGNDEWIVTTAPGGGGGATELGDLTDVDLTGVNDGDSIVFDEYNDIWVPGTTSSVQQLNDLTDVDADSPGTGNVLTFNGADWVDAPGDAAVLIPQDPVADELSLPSLGEPGWLVVTEDNGHAWIWNDDDSEWVDMGPFQGAPGTPGTPGTPGGPGEPGLVWRGQWIDSTSYDETDAVSHAGSAYFCVDDHTSSSTTEPGEGVDWETVWELLAASGEDGEDGAPGEPGPAPGPQGTVANEAALPSPGDPGDIYVTLDTGHAYGWNVTLNDWVDMGQFRGSEGAPGGSVILSRTMTSSGILLATDVGRIVEVDDDNPVTVTIELEANEAYDEGGVFEIARMDMDDDVLIVPEAGVELLAQGYGTTTSGVRITDIHGSVSLRYRGNDSWRIIGALEEI